MAEVTGAPPLLDVTLSRTDPYSDGAKARTVTLRWRDYRVKGSAHATGADGNAVKLCPLDADEFLRRFRRHLLPRGFTKGRHYGLLACLPVRRRQANNARRKLVPAARAAIAAGAKQKKPARPAERTAAINETAMPSCPHCGGTDVRFLALVLPSGHRIQRRPPIAERVREPP